MVSQKAACKLTVFLAFVACGIFASFSSIARPTIVSSVSPEFPQGLHQRYLVFIAEQMDMALTVIPMPYARRVQSLRNGDIDIMVGLREGFEDDPNIIYLQPSYERLKNSLFILKENAHKLQTPEQLYSVVIGTTINDRSSFYDADNMQLMPVSSLTQKIEMLRLGRTDAFSHFEQVTLPVLKKMGLSEQIVLASFQTRSDQPYYLAMSIKSPLMEYKTQFEKMLEQQVALDAFSELRRLHYESGN